MSEGRYRLRTPCPDCPFRNDIPPYLTKGRVREMERDLARGEFHCHKTLDYSKIGDDDEDDQPDSKNAAHCAGALILLEKLNRPSQMMRISERIGLYDRSKLDMDAPVFDSFEEMIEAQKRGR